MAFSWALFHGPRHLMLQLPVPHVSGEGDSHNRYSFRLHVARVTAISSKVTALVGITTLLSTLECWLRLSGRKSTVWPLSVCELTHSV